MPKFETLFSKYDRLVLFDTETTGLAYNRDEIIEFAAVVLERVDGTPKVVQEYDQLVALSPGGFVPPKIQELTGISTQDLRERGLPKTRVCRVSSARDSNNCFRLAKREARRPFLVNIAVVSSVIYTSPSLCSAFYGALENVV